MSFDSIREYCLSLPHTDEIVQWENDLLKPNDEYETFTQIGPAAAIGVLSQTFPYAIMDRMHVEGAASAQYTGPAMTMGAMATTRRSPAACRACASASRCSSSAPG